MSNYLPHHTKKKQVLARKELALKRRIAREEDILEMLEAAKQVRDARVRVLQAQRAMIAPTGDAGARYRRVDEQIDQLMSSTLDSILAEFGYRGSGGIDD